MTQKVAPSPKNPRDELSDHIPAMRAFAFSLTRNATLTDDIVQDALVKAWTNMDKFTPGTNLRAWLFTITRNAYYSGLRKSRREVLDGKGHWAEGLSSKPEHDGRLSMMDFEKAFLKLPEEQREALVLIGASGFSYEEAAQLCDVAIGTIKSRVNRGRAKLAELMDISAGESLDITDPATMAVVFSPKNAAF